jgi:ribonuclease P protein component
MPTGRAAGARLPRAERLRDRVDLQSVFRRGTRVERKGFVLLWLMVPGPRAVAFAAGRRLGGSVVRNRARRRLREAYRRQKGCGPGSDVRLCFVARPAALRQPFVALQQDVGEALARAGGRPAS